MEIIILYVQETYYIPLHKFCFVMEIRRRYAKEIRTNVFKYKILIDVRRSVKLNKFSKDTYKDWIKTTKYCHSGTE